MMQNLDRDEVVRVVHAPPDSVYRLVSDVTRTPEYSPEVVQCTWENGASGPVVGARFAARNSVGRGPAWTNHPVVTVAEPGHAFAVSRTEKGGGTIVWRYDLEPHAEGTLVRQSYEVTSPVNRFGWFIIGTLYGLKDRRAGLRANMEASLARVAALAESAEITQ
jgi:hypothetical protein